MKRTIALVLSLLFVLALVPATASAATDVHARLEIEVPVTTQTLFQYGTDSFNWTSASLVVTLYDDTAANVGGTILPTMGAAYATGTYVLYINGEIYDPATPYAFVATDLGSKTLTVKYSYIPTGETTAITVTEDVTISVQSQIYYDLTASGVLQTGYFAGESLNTAGLLVKAFYTNMTDPVTLASGDYTVTAASDLLGTDEITLADPLTTVQTKLVVERSESYDGSDTVITVKDGIDIVVKEAATDLSLSDSTLAMQIGDPAATVTATVTTIAIPATGCLVASVDKPAVASIDTTNLTSAGTFTITPLSVGTAIVTVRTRGSNISRTVSIEVSKPPTPVDALVLDKTDLNLPVNGTYSLTATVGPEDATDKSLTWTTSSPSDVSVDSTGTVKVLREFTVPVTITATSVSTPAVTASCTVTVNTIAVDGIAISDTSISLYKGSWATLSAVVTPFGAADPAVTWSSTNTAVATVDSNGKVTAVGIPSGETYGEAVITAQSSNPAVFATCTVRVYSAVLITSLTLNTSELAMNVGDESTLTITGTPSNATNKNIQWTSSNPEVASVSSTGLTTAKVIAASKGTAVIRGESTDGSGKYVSCVVSVNNIQVLNVYLDQSALDLSEGDTAAIAATIYPTNATIKTLKWTSSNTSVATVDSKGNVVAGSTRGYTIIRAEATDGSGKYAECVVLSKPKIYVTGITINYGTTLDLLVFDSTYLKATLIPTNASTQNVTWSSSNSSIASVDASGLVRGLALGEATITATADNKSVSISINVTNTEYNYGVAANFRRRVYVRSSPSGLSKSIGFAYLGDTFRILGRTGNWYYIQYNNTTRGYIWASYMNATKTSSSYVSAGSSSSSPSSTTSGTTATPTTVTITNCLYAVNVRESASTASTRIGKAPLGATYTYLGKEGDWYKVQYTSTTIGYIYGTFIVLS